MMRWPSMGSSASLWGLGLNRLAFLLLLLLLQQQGYSVAFVEDADTRIASVSADGSHRGTPNTVYVHDGGRRQINGDRWGLQSEQVLPFRSYNEPEYQWNSSKPFGGRRRSFGSTAALAGAAVAAALLGVVYLLLSCGVFISRDIKTIQAWGSRRRLSSREDEGPCEQTAEADEEDAAGAAAETREDQEVSTAAVVSSLNPMAPAFAPRGVFNGGQDAGEGDPAAEEDPEGSTVSLEASASASSPETAAEGAAAAGKAAAGEAAAAAGKAAAGEAAAAANVRGRVWGAEVRLPLLWAAGVDKAVVSFPYLGSYLIRLREFADFCRLYFGYLPRPCAHRVAEHLFLYAVIELAAVASLCTAEDIRQWDGAIVAFLRLGASLGVRYDKEPRKASRSDRLLLALHQMRRGTGVVVPDILVEGRNRVSGQVLPAAGEALRHMATGVNSLLQSIRVYPTTVPPDVVAVQVAVMQAVTEERLLEVLVHEHIEFLLRQLQDLCLPDGIFTDTHLVHARKKYQPYYWHAKANNIRLAAQKAAAEATAAAKQETVGQTESTVTGAAPVVAEELEGTRGAAAAAVADTEGQAALPRLVSAGHKQQQQPGRSQQERQLLQQTASAAGVASPLSVAAAPDSLQEGTAATQGPEAASANTAAKDGKKTKLLVFGLAVPPHRHPLSTVPRGPAPHPDDQPRPPRATRSSYSLQHSPQAGHHQQQVRGPPPQQHRQMESSTPSLKQSASRKVVWGPLQRHQQRVRFPWPFYQQQHVGPGVPFNQLPWQLIRWVPVPQVHGEPNRWGLGPQQQHVGPGGSTQQWHHPWHGEPFPQQQPEGPSAPSLPLPQPAETWARSPPLQKQNDPQVSSPQQQQQEEPWRLQEPQQHEVGWEPSAQQGQHAGPWGPWPQQYGPGEPWGPWPQQYGPGEPWVTFPYQHDQRGAGGPSPQQQYVEPLDVFPPQQQRVGRWSPSSMQEQEQEETLGPLTQKQQEPWNSSHPQDHERPWAHLPKQQLQQEANWETSPPQQGPKQPWQPSPRQQQQPEEQWEPLQRQGENEPWMSVLELLNGADDSSSHAYAESLGAAADVSPLPPSKSSPPKLPLGDQGLQEITDRGTLLQQQQELQWPQQQAAVGVFRGTDYTAPPAAREETAYSGSLGATADRTSLVTPGNRHADLDLFERMESIDSDGEGDAGKTGWFHGTDFTKPTVGQAPVGAAESIGRPPLPQQQQLTPGHPDLFRGVGYSASSTLQGETTGHGAQLPLQQQPQPPLGTSASIWSPTDTGDSS